MTTVSVAAPKFTSAARTPRSLRSADCSFNGTVGAVHAGDVQDAPLTAVLSGQGDQQVELPVIVDGQGTMLLAVRLGAGPTRIRLDLPSRQFVFVVLDGDQAAKDVRVDGTDTRNAAQLAAHLVHAS